LPKVIEGHDLAVIESALRQKAKDDSAAVANGSEGDRVREALLRDAERADALADLLESPSTSKFSFTTSAHGCAS